MTGKTEIDRSHLILNIFSQSYFCLDLRADPNHPHLLLILKIMFLLDKLNARLLMHLKVFPMKDLKHIVGITEINTNEGVKKMGKTENKHVYENEEFVPI